MDFKKVIDQAVREIKREVNKTILKVPEIEQKVLDATSNEPWGPHGTLMAEIAQATRNYYELQMIMSILWKRSSDTGPNWRHVYKALTVLEYLVAHGSERVIDEIKEHVYQITSLADFQYVEPNGKDQGINVQKKSQNLVLLVNDKEKIREVRQKASQNRDKYGGVSSIGGISKPSSYQSTGGSYAGDRHKEENYGQYSMRADDQYSRDRDVGRYRDDDLYGRDGDCSSQYSNRYRDHHNKDHDEDVDNYSSCKEEDRYNDFDRAHNSTDCQTSRRIIEKPATMASPSGPLGYKDAAGDEREWKPFAGQSVSTISADTTPTDNMSEDFDDFNPRATSVAAPATSQLDDLFKQAEPSGVVRTLPPPPVSSSFWGDTSDFFGDTVSSNGMPAPPNSVQKLGEDLFGNSPLKVEASGSTSVKATIKPPPSYIPTGNELKASFLPSSGTMLTSITPSPSFFAGNVLSTVGGTTFNTSTPSEDQAVSVGDDFFGFDNFSMSGTLSSSASQQEVFSLSASASSQPALSGAFQTSQPLSTSYPSRPFVGTASQGQSKNTRPQQEKPFETKSAVWADSLSKGLIDLNIAAPKSNSLADIGISFDQLQTERIKDERLSTGKSMTGMAKAMGSGSGLGVAGANAIIPPAMPMGMNNMGMVPNTGMGMGMSMGRGAGMGSMMQMGLNPGVAVRPSVGIGPAFGLGMGGFSNQQQQYGGSR